MKTKTRDGRVDFEKELFTANNEVCEKHLGYRDILDNRLFEFAVNVVKYVLTLPQKKEFDVFRYQLSRSGTSIGANYQEAIGAFNRKDFIYKLSICLKEARESNYWLKILDKLQLGEEQIRKCLQSESLEFVKIFTSSIKTTRSSLNHKSKI
jgi:four helix bundle protein